MTRAGTEPDDDAVDTQSDHVRELAMTQRQRMQPRSQRREEDP
jgi:hypothetical protein